MFNLKKERIQWDELLGKGSFGKVYPYQKSKDDQSWVVKIIHASDDEQLFNIFEEIVLGFSCDHPGIIPIKGYHIEKMEGYEYKIYLKLPRMVETLKQKFEREFQLEKYVSEEQIIKYFYSLVCSIEYLHKKKIIHRDIRPANILVDNAGNLKLCDVGAARFITEGETAYTEERTLGSLAYTAPEIRDQSHHLKKKDLFKGDAWSLGIVIAELCLKQWGIYNWKIYSLQKREKSLIEKIKELKGKYSDKLMNILCMLLDFNPERRMCIEDLKKILEDSYHFLPSDQNKHSNEEKLLEKIEGIVQMNEDGKCLVQNLKENQIQNFFKEITLKELEVESNDNFTDAGIKLLGEQIGKGFSSLQHLTLNFSENLNITDNGVKNLAEQIGNYLKSLSNLDLNFDRCLNITDNGIKRMIEQIGKNLKFLMRFRLSFAWNEKITDNGVKGLAEQIGKNFKSLKHLDLNFSGNQNIADNGVKVLAECIGNNLKSLENLTLNFYDNGKITDIGFKALAENIGKNIKSLQCLNLTFDENNNISDVGIQSLAAQIQNNLKFLHHLNLNFAWNQKVTDAGVTVLAECIGNSSSLQNLSLNFDGNLKITDLGIKSLAKHLSSPSNLIKQFSLQTQNSTFESLSSIRARFAQ